ncbi:hypothetical protein MSEN_29810 [Mycolicibacter senuensis]|uniref:Uncharacterized protein n=1 Tax=Mycolicibacter senuensis TaxID=386913 RepID=A0A7I9XMQ3_9MYCO|nr:hypothetical protein MSEN_29810 [Mycolicibacter senuensis]
MPSEPSRPVSGLVNPGLVNPGLVSDESDSDGVVRPGEVSPGVPSGGVVKPGEVKPEVVDTPGVPAGGVDSDGSVSPGEVSPGEVSPGEVRPGEVRPGEAGYIPGEVSPGDAGYIPGDAGYIPVPAPLPKPPGTGGRFTPNWDRPWVRAEISSLGRSATDAAATKSWCCGALLWAASSDTATTANGLATARAATALIVVESLRRRRFGTEVSSMCFALQSRGAAERLLPT